MTSDGAFSESDAGADLGARIRQLRSFGNFRRALRRAESAEAVAIETIAFARAELGCSRLTVYCAEADGADFELLATSTEDRDSLPPSIARESTLAERLLVENFISDTELLQPFAPATDSPVTAFGLKDTPDKLVGIAFLTGVLDAEILDELAFDTESALSARVMTRLRAEELAVLEIQERELVGLIRDVQERDEIIQKDLEEAREFQRKTLGDPPRVDGAAIEIVYRPLGQVGGDLYAVSLFGNRLRLFIADATGHGVSASLTTMFIKSVYDTVNANAPDPGSLLQAVNESIALKYKGAMMLFSAACVDLDLDSGELGYASAAHPPLCLVREGKASFIESGGAFLGVRARVRFETQRLHVSKGDGIYLFTDGFVEASGPNGGEFGEDRLLSIVQASHLARGLAGKAIDDAATAFAEKPELSDDATFIGVRYDD